jgi:putative Holliday junction resolvase
MATRAMLEMGMKKKERQEKSNIDLIAATMMLQDYLANNIL